MPGGVFTGLCCTSTANAWAIHESCHPPAWVVTMGIAQPRGCTLVPEDSSMSNVEDGSIAALMPGISGISTSMTGCACISD
jgi:hypothetical protein